VLARKLFEERMTASGRTFGPAPFKCGPSQAWLTEILGSYDSCGSSGNKYCTFGFNNPAKDAAELCQRSEPHLCGGSDVKAYSDANSCSDDPGGPAGCSADDPGDDEGGPAGCSAVLGSADVKAYSAEHSCSEDPGGPAGCSAAPDDPDDGEGGPAGCSAKAEGDGDVAAYSAENSCSNDPGGPAGCSAAPDDPGDGEGGPAGCSAAPDDPDGDG
jgi:hypothetical protein